MFLFICNYILFAYIYVQLIQIYRFLGNGKKNGCMISIPTVLRFSDGRGGSFLYDLVSQCHHHGKSMDEGHYAAIIKTSHWMKFNDDKISKSTESETSAKTVYLLLYRLRINMTIINTPVNALKKTSESSSGHTTVISLTESSPFTHHKLGKAAMQGASSSFGHTNDLHVGLDNVGNTCFMNCIAQCIIHLDEIMDIIKNSPRLQDSNVAKSLFDLYISMGQTHQKSLDTTAFKITCDINFPTLCQAGNQSQEDAFEFLMALLEKISEEISTDIKDMFTFKLGQSIICPYCTNMPR
jgi:ubiquitin C-terminal hydrolase